MEELLGSAHEIPSGLPARVPGRAINPTQVPKPSPPAPPAEVRPSVFPPTPNPPAQPPTRVRIGGTSPSETPIRNVLGGLGRPARDLGVVGGIGAAGYGAYRLGGGLI